jgi:hypothetical protein
MRQANEIGDKMDSIITVDVADAIKRAEQLGTEHGSARGSWVIDANCSNRFCDKVIDGYENGDPEVMDLCPAPLSGEWADDLTPESLCRALGFTDEQVGDIEWQSDAGDFIVQSYEAAFDAAWWDTVIQAAYAHSGDFEPCGVCGKYGHRVKEHDQ